jgi:hypothetical protein
MQINQHNYEELFLMYVDNELSVQEKEMVEAFVIQHPELAGELELLKQTVLNSEELIGFAGKEKLIRQSDLSAEDLLTYLDGEAGNELAGTIEQAAKNNEALRLELETLGKLYLKADLSVQYPGKEKLYKRGAVRSMDWRKLAIAASLLLCVSTWLVLNQSEQEKQNGAPVALNDNPVTQPAKPAPPVVDSIAGVNTSVVSEASSSEEYPKNIERQRKEPVKAATTTQSIRSSAVEGNKERQEVVNTTPPVLENGNGNRVKTPISTDQTKIPEETITKSTSIEPSVPVASTKEPVKEKKSLFKKIGKQISDRALDILSDGGDNINVAGFAIRVEK